MKKIFILTAAALILSSTVAEATSPSQLLDDSASFVIAKSVKLGLGEDEARFAPAIGEQRKVEADKHAVTKCAKDEDCADDQYCTMGMCQDLCARNTTKKKVNCSGETPICTVDNHDSYCACNDESCGAALSCKKVGSRYSCEPCGAGEKCGCPDGKMSNGAGKCVTCITDTDCADDEYCSNPKTEAAACTIFTCSTGEYVGNHQCNSCAEAITGCTDCTSSSNCTSCEDSYELSSGAYCKLKGCAADQYLNMADGQCYSCPAACSSCSTVMSSEETSACTACIDDYKLSGTQCVQKSCSDMGYSTSCGEGQDSVPANKSGSDGACYICSAISGYCTSDSQCADNQKCVSNECVGKTCSEINSSYYVPTSTYGNFIYTGDTGSDGRCAKSCGSGSNYQINHEWCLSCPSNIGCLHSNVSGTHKCCTSCKSGYYMSGSNDACYKSSGSTSNSGSSSGSNSGGSSSSTSCYWRGTMQQLNDYCIHARSCPAGYNRGYNSKYFKTITENGQTVYCMTANTGCCYK